MWEIEVNGWEDSTQYNNAKEALTLRTCVQRRYTVLAGVHIDLLHFWKAFKTKDCMFRTFDFNCQIHNSIGVQCWANVTTSLNIII